MPPKIALILCIIYIIVFYIIERKKLKERGVSLWISSIWLMMLSSRPVIQWFSPVGDVTVQNYFEGSATDRNIYIALMVIALIIIYKRYLKNQSYLTINNVLFLYLIYCAISILWSDFPLTAIKRYFRGIGTFIIIFLILSENDPITSYKATIRRTSYFLIPLSVICIKYYRYLGVSYGFWTGEAMYVGVTTHKNSLGRLCAISALYIFWSFAEHLKSSKNKMKKDELIMTAILFAMTLWLLFISHSATSLGCFIIGASIYLILGTQFFKNNSQYIGSIIFCAAVLILFFQYTFNITEVIIQKGFNRDMTLTDRTILWGDIIALVKNPFFGVGYDSYWLGDRLTVLWDKWWWKPNETHNGYLDQYIELGFFGLFLFIGVLFKAFQIIKRTLIINYDFGRFHMALLSIFVIYNITEAATKLRSMFFMIFIAGMYLCQFINDRHLRTNNVSSS
jgi:O-antigen ligase